jgi:hypothetical protein
MANHKGYELAVHRRRENRVDVGLILQP